MKRIFFIAVSLMNVVQAYSRQHSCDSIPSKNQQVLEFVKKYGPNISATYSQAVCTELVIAVLDNFLTLSKLDKNRIRIITDENVYLLRLRGSNLPKGVYFALVSNGKGLAIDSLQLVKPGDFVQFWEPTWGHCGIVKSINLENKTMELYSSFPTTNGYGVQTFNITKECYFVRLK